jgi:NAD(P)-dependent dehydrogenase (short-subunit alcohol dehydrogenase family)
MAERKKTAVVTGAKRGIGLEISRQLARDHGFHVVLTDRDGDKVAAAARTLREADLDVAAHTLDVTDANSAAALAGWLANTYGAIDVLVNNAGILLERLVPLMRPGGLIVNMSSQMGQFALAGSNMIGYRVSKTALNGLAADLAAGLRDRGISVNCCCPGWVRTDMGSKFAPFEVAEGAQTPVWLAAEADTGLTGKFFHQKREIPW